MSNNCDDLNSPARIPPPENSDRVAEFYRTNQDVQQFQILGELLNSAIAEGFCRNVDSKNIIDFSTFNPASLIFRNPVDEPIERIRGLHNNIVQQVLSGPQGYNGGSGPMSFNRAAQILNLMGGDYPTIFGPPVERNLYDVILAPPPPSLLTNLPLDPVTGVLPPFSDPRRVPPPNQVSLRTYSENIFTHMPYYIGLSKNIMHILQSMRGRISLSLESAILGILGNLNNPCFPLSVLLQPILAALQLLLRLIDMLLNLLNNLLTFILDLISSIISQIFELIASALEALIHMLGLDGTSGLIAAILSLLNDPCIRYLLYSFGGGMFTSRFRSILGRVTQIANTTI